MKDLKIKSKDVTLLGDLSGIVPKSCFLRDYNKLNFTGGDISGINSTSSLRCWSLTLINPKKTIKK